MDALIVIFLSGIISLFAAFAKKPWIVLTTSVIGLGLAFALQICELTTGHSYIHLGYEGLNFDAFALKFSSVLTLLSALIIIVGYERFKEDVNHTGEYIGLLMFSLVGAVIMTAFTDMFMFFLGLEILSIPIYVMAGSNKKDIRSNEASLKYFLTGAFATGLLLFGIAWVYGATGSFQLEEIGLAIQQSESNSSMLFVGVLLIMSSFIFKVGAAPFHFWSPDVYDGAPSIVTGFMASIVKMAAFAAFLKIFAVSFSSEILMDFWAPALAVMAVITLFVGNLSALRQDRVKRLLAYSSITHVGYTLLVILCLSQATNSTLWETLAAKNLWYYMTAYGFAIVAFISVITLVNDSTDEVNGLKGLAKRSPFLAVVLFISVISFAGIPPTAGFFGKYFVFSTAWSNYWWLVIIALANSAISIYYYLRLIGVAASSDENTTPIKVNPLVAIVLVICVLAMLGMPFVSTCLLA